MGGGKSTAAPGSADSLAAESTAASTTIDRDRAVWAAGDAPMPRARHLVLIAIVLAGGFANAPRAALGDGSAATAPPLLADAVDGEIGPGETHRFRIATAPGRWLTVELDQREVDLDLTVGDEAGAEIAASRSPGNWSPETVDLVTGSRHLLIAEVAAADGIDRRGGFRLRVVEHRPTRPDDENRLAARRRLREIERPPPGAPRLTPEEEERALRDLLDDSGVAWSDEETAYLLDLLGTLLMAQERPQEAAAAFRAGLERATTGPGHTTAVYLELSLAAVLVQQGAFAEAAEGFRRAVAAAEAAGDGPTLGFALNAEAAHLHRRGEADAARALLERALEVTRAADDAPGEISSRSSLSRVLRELGDVEAALEQHDEALRRAGERSVTSRRRTLLLNAGLFYRMAGELDRALTTFTEGLELAMANQDAGYEALFRNHLGALLCQIGEYGEAREHLERSAALAEAAADRRQLATVLLFLGWTDLGEGDSATALTRIEQGLASIVADDTLELPLLFASSVARMRLGQADEARVALVALAEKAHRRGLRLNALDAERALATVHLESGALDRAAESLAKATTLAAELGDPLRQAAIESLLARLKGERGQVEEALAHAERAIEVRESVRSRLVDPDLRTSFLARWRGDFDRAIEMLMRLAAERPGAGYERRAFELSEGAHARTLTELLAEARVDVERGISPELARQEREAERRLAHAESELNDLYTRPLPKEPEAAAHAWQERRLREARDEARRLHAEVERHIRRSSPQYAELRYPRPPTVEEVQQRLPAGTALLEYALGERSSVLFVVTREELAAVPLAPWKTIKEAVASARPDLEKPSPLTRGRLHDSLHELGRLLLAPAAGRLAGVERLIVVPDRDLFYLPFETLPDPAAPELGPGGALRRWTISYLPSAAVLRHLEREAKPAWRRELLVLANPPVPALLAGDGDRREDLTDLEGAAREARRIFDLFPPGSADLRLGAAAGEGLLTDAGVAGAARRLHIASHGVISDTEAADSYVLLAADPPHDGRLLLREVFDLDLAAELVVLSGCETALGPHVEGEGVLGFTRGFLYAGARDLVVSLWPVSDHGTEELMVELYRQILAGRPVADALRAAKLARLDDGENPFVWAPFVAFGAPGPGPP